jgi:hypothetical protein
MAAGSASTRVHGDAHVEACPVDAIFAEDQLPEERKHFTQINADYFASAG